MNYNCPPHDLSLLGVLFRVLFPLGFPAGVLLMIFLFLLEVLQGAGSFAYSSSSSGTRSSCSPTSSAIAATSGSGALAGTHSGSSLCLPASIHSSSSCSSPSLSSVASHQAGTARLRVFAGRGSEGCHRQQCPHRVLGASGAAGGHGPWSLPFSNGFSFFTAVTFVGHGGFIIGQAPGRLLLIGLPLAPWRGCVINVRHFKRGDYLSDVVVADIFFPRVLWFSSSCSPVRGAWWPFSSACTSWFIPTTMSSYCSCWRDVCWGLFSSFLHLGRCPGGVLDTSRTGPGRVLHVSWTGPGGGRGWGVVWGGVLEGGLGVLSWVGVLAGGGWRVVRVLMVLNVLGVVGVLGGIGCPGGWWVSWEVSWKCSGGVLTGPTKSRNDNYDEWIRKENHDFLDWRSDESKWQMCHGRWIFLTWKSFIELSVRQKFLG